jgi:3-oxoacyl-[acyl-carrier-protein] synthase-3
MAIERAGIDRQDIGMLLSGNSAADWASPAEACTIANALDIDVPAIDVRSACTSFFAQIHLLSMMQPDKLPRFVLLVAPEALTKTVDYSDRRAAVLWGDGALAAVISTQEPAPTQIIGSSLNSNPSGWEKVVVPRLGFFAQDGNVVQMFAIKRTVLCLREMMDRYLDEEHRFHFIGHQANLRMLQSVWRQCDIPADRQHETVEWYGNTGAASAGGVISMRWEKWMPGDDIAVVGVGAGLTWASYLVRFGDES